MLDWKPFVEFVYRHQRFLLTTHIRPDGDGLGSMLALADTLDRMPKSVRLAIGSSLPHRYHFLDPEKRIAWFKGPIPDEKPDAVIVLDTGTWNQLGDMGPYIRSLDASKAVIDHHVTQDDLGAVRFVDATAEATGRLAFEAIRALDQPLSERAANCLFVALAMDTGWFHHRNTTHQSFALAAELVEAGAQPEALHYALFEENTLSRLKLMGVVLNRLQVVQGGRVAYTEIFLRDYEATGASPQDTEDLVNYTRSLTGVDVGLILMEQPRGGIKVSFRSRGPDVAKVAEAFGGGGHRLASGAVVEGTMETVRPRMLSAVAAALDTAT